jgi:hypothetical protein
MVSALSGVLKVGKDIGQENLAHLGEGGKRKTSDQSSGGRTGNGFLIDVKGGEARMTPAGDRDALGARGIEGR